MMRNELKKTLACGLAASLLFTLILTAVSAVGFTSEEMEHYRRRSEVMSDLHSGYDAVYSGKVKNLDFRLSDFQVAS